MVADRDVVRRLFDEIAPRFVGRPGGYTRILRLGRRHGDGAELAILEFIDFTPKAKEEPTAKAGKPSLMERAKSAFGGGQKEEAAKAPAEGSAEAAPAAEKTE